MVWHYAVGIRYRAVDYAAHKYPKTAFVAVRGRFTGNFLRSATDKWLWEPHSLGDTKNLGVHRFVISKRE